MAQRMTQSFYRAIAASSYHQWNKITTKTGQDMRVSSRKNLHDPGEPTGVIVCASSSLWLPVSPTLLFDFFRDESRRHEVPSKTHTYTYIHTTMYNRFDSTYIYIYISTVGCFVKRSSCSVYCKLIQGTRQRQLSVYPGMFILSSQFLTSLLDFHIHIYNILNFYNCLLKNSRQ